MELDCPRKKAKSHADSGLAFPNEIDVDGDVNMTGSPWRKVEGNLSFLRAL